MSADFHNARNAVNNAKANLNVILEHHCDKESVAVHNYLTAMQEKMSDLVNELSKIETREEIRRLEADLAHAKEVLKAHGE